MPEYLSESYAVRHHWVKKILQQFQIQPAHVRDMFATSLNRRFEKYFCLEQDAMQQSWDINEVRWCNPPWTIWPQVSEKILSTPGTSIAVLPAWQSQQWVQNLLVVAKRTIYFEVGSKIFELGGKPVNGIKWGLYVLLIVVPTPTCVADYVPVWSSSSRRRYRRQVMHSCPHPSPCL